MFITERLTTIDIPRVELFSCYRSSLLGLLENNEYNYRLWFPQQLLAKSVNLRDSLDQTFALSHILATGSLRYGRIFGSRLPSSCTFLAVS